MHASVETELLDPPMNEVLMTRRRHPAQTVVALHNMSEHDQWVPRAAVPVHGPLVDALTGEAVHESDGSVLLSAYRVLWLRH